MKRKLIRGKMMRDKKIKKRRSDLKSLHENYHGDMNLIPWNSDRDGLVEWLCKPFQAPGAHVADYCIHVGVAYRVTWNM